MSTNRVLFASFLTYFGLIMELRAVSIMKGNNLVIGLSSVESSTMNSERGSDLSHLNQFLDVGVLEFICDFFSCFFFCGGGFMGIFNELTDYAFHPPLSSMKGNVNGQTYLP